jgi:hypothetical protein
MRRREFLGGLCSVVAWPLTAAAQQAARSKWQFASSLSGRH